MGGWWFAVSESAGADEGEKLYAFATPYAAILAKAKMVEIMMGIAKDHDASRRFTQIAWSEHVRPYEPGPKLNKTSEVGGTRSGDAPPAPGEDEVDVLFPDPGPDHGLQKPVYRDGVLLPSPPPKEDPYRRWRDYEIERIPDALVSLRIDRA